MEIIIPVVVIGLLVLFFAVIPWTVIALAMTAKRSATDKRAEAYEFWNSRRFTYRATSANGEEISGVVFANNPEEAQEIIRERGEVVSSLKKEREF